MTKFPCKTDNFVPLVVPGLSTNCGSVSSSTSPPQDSSSSSSGPVLERSDGMTPRNWCDPSRTQNKNKKRDDRRDSDDRLRDLPEWLEECTDSLEDTEVPASAHRSQDSGPERPTKVGSKSRKHSIFSHFPKDRDCEVRLRTKMTRAGEASDMITADHKVLNKGGESGNNHRYAVVVQDLATPLIQSYPCKAKTSYKTEKSLRKFLEPSQKNKSYFLRTTHWNLENHVKI